MRILLFTVFAISGFSGLIYESIWSHYLQLFLGHAAYAQSLVLVIFMGGMAIGSWIVGRFSFRWINLLLGYAIVEGIIGLAGLVFHSVFTHVMDAAYFEFFPRLDSAVAVGVLKWGASALFILPQSILLGMTFPFMTAGLIRLYPQDPGRTIATLYFLNSLGAAVGVLASGFVLIGSVGLPGTILTAGLLNVILALVVWLTAKNCPMLCADQAMPILPIESRTTAAFLLAVAAFTGAASFIYEIVWIRMLNLVLGTSTHAFELMLSAFVIGLALGGLWVRSRIDRFHSPTRVLGLVQLVMGVLALATLTMYDHTFFFMQWMLKVLTKTHEGYLVFNLLSHGVALAVMLPATFCAGMTLPLLTYVLLSRGFGEKSIGHVYALNTAGAIAGVLFAVHLGLPRLGLKETLMVGATIDLALGVLLIVKITHGFRTRESLLAATVGVVAILFTAFMVNLDVYKMASGVYRLGEIQSPENSEIVYHRDGKTATVSLSRTGRYLSIKTNGKSDAQLAMTPNAPMTPDEPTMILLGVLPVALHTLARNAAVVGMGSGLTTHSLLGAPWIKQVDTIEIEPAIVDAARNFRPRVDAAFSDPRSHIYIEDARTFLSSGGRTYDLIVSEPSNPWVSGVASLFSKEFYRLAKSRLNPGGLLTQWIQLYEIDVSLIASILKAIAPHFSDYVIYAPSNGDILVIAKNGGQLSEPDPKIFDVPALAGALKRIKIENLRDLALRRLGGRRVFQPMFAAVSVPVNSDYFPFVDLNATQARYLLSNAFDIPRLAVAPVPALEMLSGTAPVYDRAPVIYYEDLAPVRGAYTATSLRAYVESNEISDGAITAPAQREIAALRSISQDDGCATQAPVWLDSFFNVNTTLSVYLRPTELTEIWRNLAVNKCFKKLGPIERQWISLFEATANRDAPNMAKSAGRLLAEDPAPNGRRLEYVLAAGMLGHVVLGEKSEATRLWRTHGAKLTGRYEYGLLLQLLAAHAIDTSASSIKAENK